MARRFLPFLICLAFMPKLSHVSASFRGLFKMLVEGKSGFSGALDWATRTSLR